MCWYNFLFHMEYYTTIKKRATLSLTFTTPLKHYTQSKHALREEITRGRMANLDTLFNFYCATRMYNPLPYQNKQNIRGFKFLFLLFLSWFYTFPFTNGSVVLQFAIIVLLLCGSCDLDGPVVLTKPFFMGIVWSTGFLYQELHKALVKNLVSVCI